MSKSHIFKNVYYNGQTRRKNKSHIFKNVYYNGQTRRKNLVLSRRPQKWAKLQVKKYVLQWGKTPKIDKIPRIQKVY
jgi:hypothetical protein